MWNILSDGRVNGEGVKSGSSCVPQVIITVPRVQTQSISCNGKALAHPYKDITTYGFSLVKLSLSEFVEQVSFLEEVFFFLICLD